MFSAGPRPVTAIVGPSTFYVQLHNGDCNAPPSLISEGTGSINSVVVPFGRYHVMVGNPTDSDGSYALRVDFPIS
jgi:hypothetical protein